MTTTTKRRIVGLAMTGLSAWPCAQMWLVARYDLSPWKLAGWGMYAAPRPEFLGLEIFGGPVGAEGEKLTSPNPELSQAANDFLERWRWLGRLAQPDEVASLVRQQHPEWASIRIVAYKPVLDRATSRVVLSETPFEYP